MSFKSSDPFKLPTADPITAKQARALLRKRDDYENINYNICIKTVYKFIETAAKSGDSILVYNAPSMVVDGTVGDPILLARQISHKLKDLGFIVQRKDAELTISWDEADLPHDEETAKKKKTSKKKSK